MITWDAACLPSVISVIQRLALFSLCVDLAAGASSPMPVPKPEEVTSHATPSLDAVVLPAQRWIGQWIWCEGETDPYHRFLYLRRSFPLEVLPESATFLVTASDRYLLYVNGVYVG